MAGLKISTYRQPSRRPSRPSRDGLGVDPRRTLAGNNLAVIRLTPVVPAIASRINSRQIATLTSLRAATSTGTGINFLLKEQIDTLTDAMSTNALNALGDEQARLRAMGIFDTAGIGADSSLTLPDFVEVKKEATLIT
jgi:hypothetical protein